MTNTIALDHYISFFTHHTEEPSRSTRNNMLNNRVQILNRFNVTVITEGTTEKYFIEEKDGRFTISQLRRSFFGTKSYKKIAETKSQEDALNIIRILTPYNITSMEIEPFYFNSECCHN